LRATLHRHFGDQMKYSGRIGLTHRSSSPDEPELPGAKPTWYSAPVQIRKRAKEWGPGAVGTRFGAAWSGFAPMLDRWLTVTEGRGPAAVQQVYLDTVNGRVPPDQGHILSLEERFSSEVETGSRQENASNQESGVPFSILSKRDSSEYPASPHALSA